MGPAGYGDRVEGSHAVLAAARAGRIVRLNVDRRRRERPEVQEVVDLLPGGVVRLVDDIRAMATTDAPQGLVAECKPLVPLAIDDLASQSDAVVVLDHVEDPHNVGAVARSALAAGIGGMVVSSRRAAPLSAAAFKAAAGALERMPVAIVGSIPDALLRLKKAGLWVVGLDASADRSLFGLDLLAEPVAIVVGAEGAGLSRLAKDRSDLLVSIPMASESESLNASVSAALAAFEVLRVRTPE
jgi:23S rRNA (guanosine2251-2'-O)-methyltransferase